MQIFPVPRAQRGVSLIEATVVTAIVAITAGSLLPDFYGAYLMQRLETARQSLA